MLPLAFTAMTAAALLSHAYAWRVLYDTLFATDSPLSGKRVWGMRAAFAVSVVGFILCFVATVAGDPYARAIVLGFLLFPYLPVVYAVVVLAHAVIFLLVAADVRAPRGARVAVAAAISLLVIAVVGWSFQLRFPDEAWNPRSPLWALAGLAGFGYGAAAWAWSSELSESSARAFPRSL